MNWLQTNALYRFFRNLTTTRRASELSHNQRKMVNPSDQSEINESVEIVFFPSYTYASNAIYEYLSDLYKERICYVNLFDPTTHQTRVKQGEHSQGEELANYTEMDRAPLWCRESYLANRSRIVRFVILKLQMLFEYHLHLEHLSKTVARWEPRLFITTSDMTLTARIVSKLFPLVKMLVIQPNFVPTPQSVGNSFWRNLRRSITNFIYRAPALPKQTEFGLELEGALLALWQEAAFEEYSKLRGNVYLVDNPVLKILKLNVNAKKKLRNFDHQTTITIFLDDFSSLQNVSFQNLLEVAICKLVKESEKKFDILLKIHPNIDPNRWLAWYLNSSFTERVSIIQQMNKIDLFSTTDIAVSTYSYAGYEAAEIGIPSYNFIPDMRVAAETSYLTHPNAVTVNNDADLIRQVMDFGLEMNNRPALQAKDNRTSLKKLIDDQLTQ